MIKQIHSSLLVAVFLLSAASNPFEGVVCIVGKAMAQPDTIPQLLQQTPFWMQDTYVIARGADTVFITHGNGIGISVDGGQTFEIRDTEMDGGIGICLTREGPLWQFNSSGVLEQSVTGGISWQPPPSPQTASKYVIDGVSSEGQCFWFQSADRKKIVSTTDEGVSWDTLPFSSAPYALEVDWLDANHGVQLIPYVALRTTSDGGQTWDTVVSKQSPQPQVQLISQGATVAYLARSVIDVSLGAGAQYFLSTDTGHTWALEGNVDQIGSIVSLRNNLWYAIGNGSLFRSTDRSVSWKPAPYTCPNGPGAIAFGDSIHGTALGTAVTDDGGSTWDCLDTAIYVQGPVQGSSTPTIFPGGFDASSYYGLAARYGKTYICLTTDRGNSWSALFPSPARMSFLPLGRRLFFGSSGDIIRTDDYGNTFDTVRFNYEGFSSYLERTPDGTLWAGNEREFLVSLDSGATWTDRFDSVPYRWDSAQLNYSFTPVDRTTGFVKTSSGGIFRTTDAGLTWRSDSSASSAMQIPTFVLDSRHWFYSPGYRSVQYTSDAGATWDTLKLPPTNGYVGNLFAVDSERWLLDGLYTTSAGASWLPIPGWDNGYHVEFTVMDSSTAFGGQLWRLDMPWYVKPQERVTSIPAAEQPTATASPNPMGKFTILSFTTATEGEVKIEVFDVLGNKVTGGFSTTLASGNHTAPLSLAGLPAGIYYARIATPSGIQTVKLSKE